MHPQMVIIYSLASLLIAWWGKDYRLGFWGYFFASLLLTPAVGCLLVIASTPVKGKTRNSQPGGRGS